MKTNQMLPRLCLLVLSVVLLTACDRLTDKDVNYYYKVENNTNATVEVLVKVKQNMGVMVQGSGSSPCTLAPGGSTTVWVTSGFTTGEVYDEEKGNTEIYWISVSATRNGRAYQTNFNNTTRWAFHKKNRYSASYTLTLTNDDF